MMEKMLYSVLKAGLTGWRQRRKKQTNPLRTVNSSLSLSVQYISLL